MTWTTLCKKRILGGFCEVPSRHRLQKQLLCRERSQGAASTLASRLSLPIREATLGGRNLLLLGPSPHQSCPRTGLEDLAGV